MPELPEIALYKNYLDETALNKKIVKLEIIFSGGLRAPEADFKKSLKNEKFLESTRLGKYLYVKTSGKKHLVFHFGMTGKLEAFRNQDPPKYSQVVFTFEEDSHLAYVCRRKLGKIFLTESLEIFKEEHELGDDALQLSEKEFLSLLDGKTGSIKGALTDQHLLAGIGNVYSDEMLYQVGIHPKTKTNALSEKEKKQLYKAMKKVLQLAIEKEGIRKEFPKSYLIRHREDGADCPKCSGKIKKIKVSGRSTYFCPSCQEEKG